MSNASALVLSHPEFLLRLPWPACMPLMLIRDIIIASAIIVTFVYGSAFVFLRAQEVSEVQIWVFAGSKLNT